MKKRQLDLLCKMIDENQYISVKEYAKLMNVSEKSIRRDLDELTELLDQFNGKIIKKSGIGILLDVPLENKSKFISYINQLYKLDGYQCMVAGLNARKQDLKLNLLLNAPNVFSITILAEEYYISKSSIHMDLNSLESELHQYQLSIIKNTGGSYIQGNEIQIRRALLNELYLFLQDYHFEDISLEKIDVSKNVYSKLLKVFDKEHVEKIKNVIEISQPESFRKLSYREKKWLITGILLQLYRMKQFGMICKEDDGRVAMFDHIEGFHEIVNCEESIIGTKLAIEELSFLDWLFANVGLTYIPKVNLEETAEMFSDDFIDAFSAIIGLPLRSKENFCLSVRQHIFFMLTRVSNNQKFKNPILERMRNEYRAMEMVCRIICKILCSKYRLPEINDDEISYLMVYIQSELICYESTLNTAIVFDEKPSLRSFFQAQLNRRFHNLKIEFFDSISDVSIDKYDLILSTIGLEDKSYNYVSSILNENDFDLIDSLITKIISDKKNYLLELKRILNDLHDIGVMIELKSNIKLKKNSNIIWEIQIGIHNYCCAQNLEKENRLLIQMKENQGMNICFLFNDWDYMLFASKFIYLLENSPSDIVNQFEKNVSEVWEYE